MPVNITNAEALILKVLWKEEKLLSISQINIELEKENINWAYTTVATFLKRMEKKKIVSAVKEGRSFRYQALAKEDEVSNGVGTIVNNYFQGSLKNFLAAFSKENAISKQELESIKEWVNELDDESK